MSFTFGIAFRQVHNLFGNVKGLTAAVAETNYTAAITTSTVRGPGMILSAVQDAILDSLMEIVEAICATPFHPERRGFDVDSASLANLAQMPDAISGAKVIGVPGYVKDATNNRALVNVSLIDVRDFNEFSTTVYTGLDQYWYAFNENRIEHTRTNAIVRLCAFNRPTFVAANDVPLDDYHLRGLSAGAARFLAGKEGTFRATYEQCSAIWTEHLASIKAYGMLDKYGRQQAAASVS